MFIYKSADYMPISQAFEVQKYTYEKNYIHPPHQHDFIELIYIASGEGTHEIDGISYRLCRGDMLFINYHQTHSFQAEEQMVFYNFFVKPEYISERLANAESLYDIFSFLILDRYFDTIDRAMPLAHFSAAEMLEIERLSEEMLSESEAEQPGYALVLDGYMRILLAKMLRVLCKKETSGFCRAVTPELLAYIDENYTKPITVTELANQCFYHPTYLGRIFKNTFGISLHDYIGRKRIDYAKKLLLESSDTVDTIAAAVGYADKKQFYKLFREQVGCTPKQYRQNLEKV